MPGDPGQLVGYRLRRQDEVDAACRHGAAWHRVIARRFVLGEGDTPFALDRLQPERAVGGGAREDHADGALALVGGQRLEEGVDRTPRRSTLRPRPQGQTPPLIPRWRFGGIT